MPDLPDLSRPGLLRQLAALVDGLPLPARVGVDGPDAAGKTTLADELATAIGSGCLSDRGGPLPAAGRGAVPARAGVARGLLPGLVRRQGATCRDRARGRAGDCGRDLPLPAPARQSVVLPHLHFRQPGGVAPSRRRARRGGDGTALSRPVSPGSAALPGERAPERSRGRRRRQRGSRASVDPLREGVRLPGA